MTLNSLTLVGNLGSTPEIRLTSKQKPYCRLEIATDDYLRSETGSYEKVTSWCSVTAFGRVAENCARFLTKGSGVLVEGSVRNTSYTDKSGETKRTMQVVVKKVSFLGNGSTSKPKQIEVEELADSLPDILSLEDPQINI